LIVLPALAGLVGMSSLGADAATDNKAQFKYQDKPGPSGHRCSQCQLFKPPHSCAVVHGVISPNGWCTAWVKKS
jgi:hypothetical protein